MNILPAPTRIIDGRKAFAPRILRAAVAMVPLALSLALAGCGAAGQGAKGGMPAMPPPEVTVVTLKTQPVTLQRSLPGRVSARLVAEVRPQTSGLVRKTLFTEGSVVRAGQLLYLLDDSATQAALATAQANVERAEAGADSARRNATRASELIKSRMISVQDNDNLQSASKQAEADLSAARAALKSAQVNQQYTRITSPIAGRIGKTSVTEGALVVANQAAPLATVQRLDEVYVDVTQSSREWLQLRRELGESSGGGSSVVQLTLEDGQRYPVAGKLQFTDVTVDETTGSFLLRILVRNPQGLLLPGMYVTATLGEHVLKDALLAPQQGILRDPKGSATAMVVGSDGKVQPRSLSVLRTVGDQWLVGSGLSAGDRLIVEGLQKVQPGMAVTVREQGAATGGGDAATGGATAPAGAAQTSGAGAG
jgi:membrane fusion protein (multidrug efflux system)